MKNSNLTNIILASFFAVIIGIFAQITVPLGVVSFTLQTFGVSLAASLLGKKWGTISVVIYLLLGLILPVYAGGHVGLSSLFGPTGGFLFSFIPMAFVIGLLTNRTRVSIPWFLFANCIGAIICLSIGTIWLKFALDLTWIKAFIAGAGIFIPIEISKAIVSATIAVTVLNAVPAKIKESLS